MNILILHNSLDYNQSGVERVSFLLKEELTNRDYNCFEGCITGENISHQENVFIYNFNDPRKTVLEDLASYINKNKIDVIINQGLFDPNINNAILYLKKNRICKNIFCLHNAPSAFARKLPLSLLEQIKIFIWYLVKFQNVIFDYRNHRLKKLAEMFDIADRFILLSKTYTDELCKTIKIHDSQKIRSINNPLTFQKPIIDFKQKKKQVLILCRLDDFQKNISSALRIWRIIEDSGYNDWQLVIAGTGKDETKLHKQAKKLALKNIVFSGKTNHPELYYQESSLFMMTSHIEGWPMTLLEAQQNGCIPIAYNTFSALSEIIEDGFNGFIIEKYDEQSFATKIMELMRNISLRQDISQNCAKNCQKFTSKNIGDEWDSLLQEL